MLVFIEDEASRKIVAVRIGLLVESKYLFVVDILSDFISSYFGPGERRLPYK